MFPLRVRMVTIAISACALTGLVTPAAAQLTGAQQTCVNGLNKDFAKVDKAVTKQLTACLQSNALGKPLNKDNPAIDTLEECVADDQNGKIEKATDKTKASFTKNCTPPPEGKLTDPFPPYGASDEVAVNAAGRQRGPDLIHELFGADLDTAGLLTEQVNRDRAKCQQALWKTVLKCQQTQLKEFLKCKKLGLKPGDIRNPSGLEACVASDPKDKIAKKCDLTSPTPDNIRRTIDKQCVSKGVDLSDAFRPCATDDPEALHQCIRQSVECVNCLGFNGVDGLDLPCDLFDATQCDGTLGLALERLSDALAAAYPILPPPTMTDARGLFYLMETPQDVAADLPSPGGLMLGVVGSLKYKQQASSDPAIKVGVQHFLSTLAPALSTVLLSAAAQTEFHEEGAQAGCISLGVNSGLTLRPRDVVGLPITGLTTTPDCGGLGLEGLTQVAWSWGDTYHVILSAADAMALRSTSLPLSEAEPLIHELLHVAFHQSDCITAGGPVTSTEEELADTLAGHIASAVAGQFGLECMIADYLAANPTSNNCYQLFGLNCIRQPDDTCTCGGSCGNDVLESGEECDGLAASPCPQHCGSETEQGPDGPCSCCVDITGGWSGTVSGFLANGTFTGSFQQVGSDVSGTVTVVLPNTCKCFDGSVCAGDGSCPRVCDLDDEFFRTCTTNSDCGQCEGRCRTTGDPCIRNDDCPIDSSFLPHCDQTTLCSVDADCDGRCVANDATCVSDDQCPPDGICVPEPCPHGTCATQPCLSQDCLMTNCSGVFGMCGRPGACPNTIVDFSVNGTVSCDGLLDLTLFDPCLGPVGLFGSAVGGCAQGFTGLGVFSGCKIS